MHLLKNFLLDKLLRLLLRVEQLLDLVKVLQYTRLDLVDLELAGDNLLLFLVVVLVGHDSCAYLLIEKIVMLLVLLVPQVDDSTATT